MEQGTGIVVAGMVALLAGIYKFGDFLRMLTNLKTERSGVLMQVIAWTAGVAGIFLFAATQFGSTVVLSNISLDKMDGPTKFWVGYLIGSSASVVVDLKQAIDSSDSAKKPPLLPPPGN